jgi:hypothetical protein
MVKNHKEYTTLYRAITRAAIQIKEYGYIPAIVQGIKGPIDVIGIKDSEIFLVKVKIIERGKQPLPEVLGKTLSELKTPPGVRKEVWAWEKKSGFHYLTVSDVNQETIKPGGVTRAGSLPQT